MKILTEKVKENDEIFVNNRFMKVDSIRYNSFPRDKVTGKSSTLTFTCFPLHFTFNVGELIPVR